MNNKQAIDFLYANNSNISQTVHSFLQIHELPQSEFSSYRYKFTKLVDLRKKSIKNTDLHVWEQAPFYEGIPLKNFESLSIVISKISKHVSFALQHILTASLLMK